ncbi:four-carbon acid sugar kinase family protein [Caproiciproducens sp. AGMB10547]|uniref:3-oxo-tetronate kinase n=2 Tax=Caproiciproducens faecalis TaxID=2820301 RepID=A0ABS7DNX1_9FIRM|nr:four-carbon acid sugar kinase family protein [Caproiciproducens faecalis]
MILGCIADDFTGASDAASFLAKGGMRTVLCNGIPQDSFSVEEGTEAVVIALKTRTETAEKAVSESFQASQWLKKAGAKQLYFKYCSTFDSTPRGNIGAVGDMLLEKNSIPYTVLCPSLPINKRTVRDGSLYVDQVPLSESHMKNHPLTPMWDSYLPNLMRGQSKYPCLVLGREEMSAPDEEIIAKVAAFAKENPHFYVVPEYEDDRDAKRIVSLFGKLPLLTGGSGLMQPLAEEYTRSRPNQAGNIAPSTGKAILVAGSCSVATQGQVRSFLENGGTGIVVNASKLLSGEQTAESLWQQAASFDTDSVLFYSAGSGGKPEKETGDNREAELLEQTMARLAQKAVRNGYTRIIVAGGETSGAVTKALHYHAYQIGESIAPGVPVMVPLEHPEIRLVLKSGNFGQSDFFLRALQITEKGANS